MDIPEFKLFLAENPKAAAVWAELVPNVDMTDPEIARVAIGAFLLGYSAGKWGHWPESE